MKTVFDILFSIFAIYVAIHAIVFATAIVFGMGPAIWLLILCIPVFFSNVGVIGANARADIQRKSRRERRREWRGY